MTTHGSNRIFATLIADIQQCAICQDHLPLGPRPVLQADPNAAIMIVGQAPGTAVHNSGIPFDDPSGDRLRHWLGVDHSTFYDPTCFALVPMGFCYPGRGKGGDLPPRQECAAAWRVPLTDQLQRISLTILMGRHAINWYLPDRQKQSLSDTVKDWREIWPKYMPLPHPSPRNNRWLKNRPWLESDVIPALRRRVGEILAQ